MFEDFLSSKSHETLEKYLISLPLASTLYGVRETCWTENRREVVLKQCHVSEVVERIKHYGDIL